MIRLCLAASFAANLLLAAGLYNAVVEYDTIFADREEIILNYEGLLLWACEHGNGGAECGED